MGIGRIVEQTRGLIESKSLQVISSSNQAPTYDKIMQTTNAVNTTNTGGTYVSNNIRQRLSIPISDLTNKTIGTI